MPSETLRWRASSRTEGMRSPRASVPARIGIAIDSASHRAILSVWNGFAILDLGTQSITKVIQAPPSENFGFDSVHGRIIAPFYDCTTSKNTMGPPSFCGDFKGADGMPMTDGLNIIDLSDDAVYTYQNPAAKNPLQPVGDEPDSAAIDPNTGLAVIPSEGSNFASVIDVSKARFDRGAKTFTAPTELIDKAGLEGIAMEATQHIAFWEQEHSSRIAVADLTKQPASSTYAEALMPYLPSGAAWSNIGDPHGIAVTTGIRDSAPVGFVVTSDRKWVARVDLKKMLSLPRTPLTNQIEAKDIMTAVTFLDARTKL